MINFVTANNVRGYANDSAELLTVYIYLADHRADTLSRVVKVVEAFAADNNTEDVKFLLAAGSSGIEAATNIVVEKANKRILFWVYAVVILMCFITFRNWRAVVCAILPLMLTSILAEALMAKMGIGVKVSTLPVIALGVGIGVDYALYILTVVLRHYRAGRSLSESFYRADLFTGKVVLLIGVTLSVSVATWAWSPIKFQADMGLLLAFMFFVNMLGALLQQPALEELARRFGLEPAPVLCRLLLWAGRAGLAGAVAQHHQVAACPFPLAFLQEHSWHRGWRWSDG